MLQKPHLNDTLGQMVLDGLLGLQRGQKSGENTTEMLGRYCGMEVLQSSPVWGLGDLHSFSGSGWTTHRPFKPLCFAPSFSHPESLIKSSFGVWGSHAALGLFLSWAGVRRSQKAQSLHCGCSSASSGQHKEPWEGPGEVRSLCSAEPSARLTRAHLYLF